MGSTSRLSFLTLRNIYANVPHSQKRLKNFWQMIITVKTFYVISSSLTLTTIYMQIFQEWRKFLTDHHRSENLLGNFPMHNIDDYMQIFQGWRISWRIIFAAKTFKAISSCWLLTTTYKYFMNKEYFWQMIVTMKTFLGNFLLLNIDDYVYSNISRMKNIFDGSSSQWKPFLGNILMLNIDDFMQIFQEWRIFLTDHHRSENLF